MRVKSVPNWLKACAVSRERGVDERSVQLRGKSRNILRDGCIWCENFFAAQPAANNKTSA